MSKRNNKPAAVPRPVTQTPPGDDPAIEPTTPIVPTPDDVATEPAPLAPDANAPATDDEPTAAAGKPDGEAEPESGLIIGDVLGDLAAFDGQVGRENRFVENVKLTGPQARTQARLQAVLAKRGVNLTRRGGVYAWLLDQVEQASGGVA